MKKHSILIVVLLNLVNLMQGQYECSKEFIEAWNIKDIDLCHTCVEREKEIEKEKGSIRNLFKTVDTSLVGSPNYGMSWNEIEKKVTEIFSHMRENGRIVTKKEFEKIQDQYYILEQDDISRIWGADYLKRAISQDPALSQYDVPDYVIVVHDFNDLKTFTTFIEFSEKNNAPEIKAIRTGVTPPLQRPKVYFKKILGNDVTSKSKVLKKIGFDDFLGENIIEDAITKVRYIVDTEQGSFDAKAFKNFKNKDFIGLGKDCQQLYIKKLLYNEYKVDASDEYKEINLNLLSVTISSTAVIDTFAQALHAIQ